MRWKNLSDIIIAALLVVVFAVLLTSTGDDANEKGVMKLTTKGTPTKNPATLTMLNVPCYVYDELFFSNATVGNYTLTEWLQTLRDIPLLKHTDDCWFAKAALQHPLRTNDPSRAKLFIVPLITNQITYGGY